MTPKSRQKENRHNSCESKNNDSKKRKPSALSRVTFIRKKALNQTWGKNSMETKSNKLTLSTNNRSSFKEVDRTLQIANNNRQCRLNITFGDN